jgi:hypothetical protein
LDYSVNLRRKEIDGPEGSFTDLSKEGHNYSSELYFLQRVTSKIYITAKESKGAELAEEIYLQS